MCKERFTEDRMTTGRGGGLHALFQCVSSVSGGAEVGAFGGRPVAAPNDMTATLYSNEM